MMRRAAGAGAEHDAAGGAGQKKTPALRRGRGGAGGALPLQGLPYYLAHVIEHVAAGVRIQAGEVNGNAANVVFGAPALGAAFKRPFELVVNSAGGGGHRCIPGAVRVAVRPFEFRNRSCYCFGVHHND